MLILTSWWKCTFLASSYICTASSLVGARTSEIGYCLRRPYLPFSCLKGTFKVNTKFAKAVVELIIVRVLMKIQNRIPSYPTIYKVYANSMALCHLSKWLGLLKKRQASYGVTNQKLHQLNLKFGFQVVCFRIFATRSWQLLRMEQYYGASAMFKSGPCHTLEIFCN